jgi:quinolinate synthase
MVGEGGGEGLFRLIQEKKPLILTHYYVFSGVMCIAYACCDVVALSRLAFIFLY